MKDSLSLLGSAKPALIPSQKESFVLSVFKSTWIQNMISTMAKNGSNAKMKPAISGCTPSARSIMDMQLSEKKSLQTLSLTSSAI